jgi:hypothetical protein
MTKHYKYSDIQNIKLCRVAKLFLLEDTSTTPQYIDHPQSPCYNPLIRMIKSFPPGGNEIPYCDLIFLLFEIIFRIHLL